MNNEPAKVDDKSSPVKVDVKLGASASASVEVKTEIPSSASGRLVDSLTDIIRPFSEQRGLRADQIRLQREDVLIKIATKAKKRLTVENTPIKEISNRFMVPFLEAASREEQKSKLVEWWTKLLVAAGTDTENQHPIFIDILSKLTSREAKLAEKYWSKITKHTCNSTDETANFEHISISSSIQEKITPENVASDTYGKFLNRIVSAAIIEWRSIGIFCIAFQVPTKHGRQRGSIFVGDETGIDVLLATGVMRRKTIVFDIASPWFSDATIRVEYLCFTNLGAKFMSSCAGQSGLP